MKTPAPMAERVQTLAVRATDRLEKWDQGADSTKAGQAPSRLVDAVLVLGWCVLRAGKLTDPST